MDFYFSPDEYEIEGSIDDKQILDICEVADKEDDYRNALKDIFKKEFKLTEKRIQVLATYNDIENAKIIVENLL